MAFWNKKNLKEQSPNKEVGLAGVRNLIAVASGKGGVGKSTVAANLASALQFSGYTVGLLDADIYGPSQPRMLGASDQKVLTGAQGELIPNESHGVKFVSMGLLIQDEGPVVWRAPMVMKMLQQFIANVVWGNLDYLIIDLPPGTGDVQLTLAQNMSLTGAIVVTTPQDVALGIAKRGLKMFQQVKVPILGIVENMSGFECGHCHQVTPVFKEGGARKMAHDLNLPFLGSIPLDPALMEASDEGQPVLLKDVNSVSSQAFIKLSHELQSSLKHQGKNVEPVEVSLNPQSHKLEITWNDHHRSEHLPYHLRIYCACATCVDEVTGKKILDPKKIPLDLGITNIASVGNYALSAHFTDGHSTGIYSFERLRRLCECPECSSQRVRQESTFSV